MFEEIIENIIAMNTQNLTDDTTYVGQDGLRYCKKCNTPRQTILHTGKGNALDGTIVPTMCKCMQEANAKRDAKLKEQERIIRVRHLQEQSMLGEKYKNVRFSNIDTSQKDFAKVFKRCRTYCEKSSEILESGIGIYLFGDKGTGKSTLNACIVNELTSQGYTALYTNFSEIAKTIKASYNGSGMSEFEFTRQLRDVQFLCIDDFGTEAVSRGDADLWMQEKVFDLINLRYNFKRPTLYTSNYSLNELVNERGMAEKTVDRIMETSAVIKLRGESYRRKVREERKVIF